MQSPAGSYMLTKLAHGSDSYTDDTFLILFAPFVTRMLCFTGGYIIMTTPVSPTESQAPISTSPPTSLVALVDNIEALNLAIAQIQHTQSIIALDSESMDLCTRAASISLIGIENPAEREAVDRLASDLRTKRDSFEADYRRYKDPIVRLGQFFDGAWRSLRATLSVAISTCDLKILNYDREKAAAAERERARLQRLADAAAEQDRQRLMKQTERAATKATGLERRALKEELRDVASSCAVAPPVHIETRVPETAGQKTRLYWQIEIFDLRALLAAVVAGDSPEQSIEPALSFLGQQARAMANEDGTNAMNKVKRNGLLPFPGVRAVPDERRGR